MHIPNYSQIVSPIYHVTWKKNDFEWGPEQQQAFEQIKGEVVHAVALVQSGEGKMLKMLSTPQPGRMAQPGVSGRKHQGRIEVKPWVFGVGDTKDPKPNHCFRNGWH